MKSRHLSAMHTATYRRLRRSLPWAAAFLLFWVAASAFAQDEADPPGRVAHMSVREGSVVFAPQGEDEWTELPQNRPLTTGDRLWSDRGARAELQLGSATLHVDGETHLGLSDLDERSAQFLLQQGSVNARVREVTQGENFEIGTPNLAFRALQPGDYRIDVAPDGRETRVSVASGLATVFGEAGQSIQLGAGQQAAFAGRSLGQVHSARPAQDGFGAWAAERNRLEDQSMAARHVPRGVVGYAQLDPYGSWGQDPNYGAVWYPRVAVEDWAPYRYGHWEWVQPWGWTWIDDAPWGFAPFHYGRWAMIGHRWAWVPGRMAARPVYSPALVVFMGGGGSSFSISSGPAVGWYPLAPGEAWWPTYRTSPRYVNFANFNINLHAYPRHYDRHHWRHHAHAWTAVREDDFRRGRRVDRHWHRLQPNQIGHARIGVVPGRPDWHRGRDRDRDRDGDRDQVRGRDRDRDQVRDRDERVRERPRLQAAPPRTWVEDQMSPAMREQIRAVREQRQLQRDAEREQLQLQRQAERAARQQQRQAEQAHRQDDPRAQRERMLRQQQEQAGVMNRGGEQRGWRDRDDDDRRGGRGHGRMQREDNRRGGEARGNGNGRMQRGDGESRGRGHGHGNGNWQRN